MQVEGFCIRALYILVYNNIQHNTRECNDLVSAVIQPNQTMHGEKNQQRLWSKDNFLHVVYSVIVMGFEPNSNQTKTHKMVEPNRTWTDGCPKTNRTNPTVQVEPNWTRTLIDQFGSSITILPIMIWHILK